ncbi:ABC transporter permease subunit [Phytohabitans flavus]|uniref:ABC transporter n=1 Tax=Phytohabitans flavus TaxID=1076124 RepID=A0A6F8Y6V9_9ACTN|nr:ABC transporter permease [Phytohabitans flavus]BCB81797.1 ABC transporter [Phytohabitans flavus]
MTAAAEWVKLWTVRSTWWCVAASVTLMGCTAFLLANDFVYDIEHPDQQSVRDTAATTQSIVDPAAASVSLAQFAVIALAMLVITSEYSTGAIRSTLRAVPVRGRVLLAKAAVAAAATFGAGLVLAVAGLFAARLGLREYAVVDLGDAGAVAVRIAVYLALVAVFSVGMGAALRSAVGTLSAVLVLLVGLSMVVPEPASEYMPGVAGGMFVADGDASGALILVAWTGAVLAAGYAVIRRRDA